MIEPVIEFMEVNWREADRASGKWWILDDRDGSTYEKGVVSRLKASYGIYMFYDSRGSALYAGKAVKQSLWIESNLAVNRDRQDLQKIRRVDHPSRNVQYKGYYEKARQPIERSVKLHEIASYYSAYDIKARETIPFFEALIVRAFANDLLNKRMEKFPATS